MSRVLLWVAWSFSGCATQEAPATVAPTRHPELPAVSPASLARDADQVTANTPSPLEMQRAIDASGLGARLAERVRERAPARVDASPDRAAVRTGVALADLLLTTHSATDAALIARLEDVRAGMRSLRAGADIDATLMDQIGRVRSGAVTRDELLEEFEELSQVVIPELSFEGRARAVPLIEAGSWLEGANLLAGALGDARVTDGPAASMLRAPTVIERFQTLLATDVAAQVSEPVSVELTRALATLHQISERPALDGAALTTVQEVTGSVLALL